MTNRFVRGATTVMTSSNGRDHPRHRTTDLYAAELAAKVTSAQDVLPTSGLLLRFGINIDRILAVNITV